LEQTGLSCDHSDRLARQLGLDFDSQFFARHHRHGVRRNNGVVVGPSELFTTSSGIVGMSPGESLTLKNLQVTAHVGLHNVPVRMFEVTCPNGLKFLHTGDNQTSVTLPTLEGCVMLLNAWVNESGSTSSAVGVRNSLERVRPRLMIPDARILAISGAPLDWRVLEMAKTLGASETLAKPFKTEELLQVAARLLRTG
jgi:hypothetical protein